MGNLSRSWVGGGRGSECRLVSLCVTMHGLSMLVLLYLSVSVTVCVCVCQSVYTIVCVSFHASLCASL